MDQTRTKLPRRPKAVIFDMDGVIFDTERMYQAALAAAGVHVGCHISRQTLLSTVGMSWPGCRQMLQTNYGQYISVDALIEDWLARFAADAVKGLPLKLGVRELLDKLDTLSLPRAIATSAYPEDARRNLAAHDIAHRFDTVVAHGDCAAAKPAPDPFLLAAKRLRVEPAWCLAIEDSSHGVRSASGAGMMTVMVPDTIAASEADIALCVAIANDLHEVRMMLADG